jgi:predicted alpha/beta superfamily hydrolase
MKNLVIILVSLLLLSSTSNAQKSGWEGKSNYKPFVLGEVNELSSSQLGEQRILNIYLPDGYDADSNQKKMYPVVYLLDGSANEDFIHITGIVQFLTGITGAMPPTIVVGIANVDRKRDFTFPTTVEKDKKDLPTTGGSDKFMLFLEKDLEPYIEKQYRAGGPRTIIGQSLGGLLATEVLLKKPALFDNYIIVSPSLWWDNESLLKKATELEKTLAGQKIHVCLAVGNEEKVMVDDVHQLADILQKQGGSSLKLTFQPVPEENHLTILHNAVYRAFVELNRRR